MVKAIMAALKYRQLLPVAIEFVQFIQSATADGKLSKDERSKVMGYMWQMIKEAEKVNGKTKKAA